MSTKPPKGLVKSSAIGEEYSVLADLFTQSGFVDWNEPFTLFAPSNKAFEKTLSQTLLEKLSEDAWQLRLQNLLAYHANRNVIELGDIMN